MVGLDIIQLIVPFEWSEAACSGIHTRHTIRRSYPQKTFMVDYHGAYPVITKTPASSRVGHTVPVYSPCCHIIGVKTFAVNGYIQHARTVVGDAICSVTRVTYLFLVSACRGIITKEAIACASPVMSLTITVDKAGLRKESWDDLGSFRWHRTERHHCSEQYTMWFHYLLKQARTHYCRWNSPDLRMSNW